MGVNRLIGVHRFQEVVIGLIQYGNPISVDIRRADHSVAFVRNERADMRKRTGEAVAARDVEADGIELGSCFPVDAHFLFPRQVGRRETDQCHVGIDG